jgi:hypothetical protein
MWVKQEPPLDNRPDHFNFIKRGRPKRTPSLLITTYAPGMIRMRPLIRRTDALKHAMTSGLDLEAKSLVESCEPMMDRRVNGIS